MTYNVFGGMLNLAQSSPLRHTVIIEAVNMHVVEQNKLIGDTHIV